MTPRITVRINDRRVWDPMSTAARVCLALHEHEHIELFFDNEAPTIEETELPDFFATLEQAGVDLSRISVITGNLKESCPTVQIHKDPTAMFELTEFQKVCDQLPKTKNIQKHFGLLVGRCTMPRLVLSSYLWSSYKEKTLQTFHWQPNHDYHRTHLELEQIAHHYGFNSQEFAQAVDLLKHAPLLRQTVTKYPILHPENLHMACSWYPEFFVDIVCETWYGQNTFFLTEKFWRAVATRTPFIIHGPQWILQNLKLLGFQTFDRWWDEGYSEDPAHHNIIEIKQIIDYVSAKSTGELELMYQQMSSVLDNNLEVMMKLRYADFEKLYKDTHATR